MKIPDLIAAVRRIDPTLRVEVHDSMLWVAGSGPERSTIVTVTSERHGEGSREIINLRMGVRQLSDEVLEVVPGSTSNYWQVAPLVEALRLDSATETVRG